MTTKLKVNRNMKTCADIYKVQSYYQRFNQKFNMTRQECWDDKAVELRKRRIANLTKLLEKNTSGYTLKDWAFYSGSRTNIETTGFSVNEPNKEGNSWQPLAERNPRTTPYVPVRTFGKWNVDDAESSKLIKKLGLHLGADQIGFCLLDRRWVYSHWYDEQSKKDYPIRFSDDPGYETYSFPVQLEDGTQVIPKEMRFVVVLLYEMDKDAIAAAPGLTEMAEVSLAYSRISFVTASLAESIRSLGYNAIPSANDTALSIPLAIDAGLGQLGRNAKLINPLFGPRCRISKIITDLPLAPDEPIDFGVTEFCYQCQKCARSCPPKAITFGKRSFEPLDECANRGVLLWQLDHKKCNEYWASVGTNCGICIRVCPFNKGKSTFHNVVRWFVKNLKFVDPLILKADNILYKKSNSSTDKFWHQNRRAD